MRRRYRVLGNVAFYLALFVAAWKIARAYICHGVVLLALTGCAYTYTARLPSLA